MQLLVAVRCKIAVMMCKITNKLINNSVIVQENGVQGVGPTLTPCFGPYCSHNICLESSKSSVQGWDRRSFENGIHNLITSAIPELQNSN